MVGQQVSKTEITNSLNKIVRRVIMETPHWGLILASINRLLADMTSNVPIPTAGVYKEGLNMNMAFNPEFMASLNEKQRAFILMHELLHVAFMHPTVGERYADKQLFNVAADVAINQIVEKLSFVEWPKDEKGNPSGMRLDTFGWGLEHADQDTKYYYDLLMQDPDKSKSQAQCQAPAAGLPEPGEGRANPMSGDGEDNPLSGVATGDHDTWKIFDNMSDSEKNLMQGTMNRQMADALRNHQKLIGDLPGSLRDALLKILNPKPTYNWRRLFRKLTSGYARSTYLKTTRKRESDRFPGMPGIKIKQHASVMVAVDTSGSVSNKDLVEFFTEVHGMKKSGVKVTVVECDAAVDKKKGVYEFRNLDQVKKRKMLTGGGGTSFDPPMELFNELGTFNMLLYLTDGYAAIPKIKINKPLVWVLCRSGKSAEAMEDYPGYAIKIKDNED